MHAYANGFDVGQRATLEKAAMWAHGGFKTEET
ncbi:hypothetical protein BH11PSE8_BH11PSE8_28440 [soil metagenome]